MSNIVTSSIIVSKETIKLGQIYKDIQNNSNSHFMVVKYDYVVEDEDESHCEDRFNLLNLSEGFMYYSYKGHVKDIQNVLPINFTLVVNPVTITPETE